MSKHEKILIVLVMGSIWGALELFGGDLFRSMGVPNKSAYLFGLGLIIVYASKKVGGFTGSVIIMALIAGLFKTASSNFYACQFTAVMINGVFFEGLYQAFGKQLDSSALYRGLAAPLLVYLSFGAFAIGAVYIIRESNWAAAGFAGVINYLSSDAAIAAIVSIFTINLGYYLGTALRPVIVERKFGMPAPYFRIVSFALAGAIWIAGQIY